MIEQPAPASVGAPTARLVLGASKAAILPTGFLVRACRVRFHRTLEDVHAFGDLAGDGSAPRGLRDLLLAAANGPTHCAARRPAARSHWSADRRGQEVTRTVRTYGGSREGRDP